MTTLYWTLSVITCMALLAMAFVSKESLRVRLLLLGAGFMLIATAWFAYEYHFEQVFVKRYGGSMTITAEPGSQHLGMTWKGDNLWIEQYYPETNTCSFVEYSKGKMLRGTVNITDCYPVSKGTTKTAAAKAATP